jgi:hypothetical protein
LPRCQPLARTAGDGGLEFAESRPCGGAYVLDQLWQRLGIGMILAGLASSGRGRPRDAQAAERVLFGLVANRALADQVAGHPLGLINPTLYALSARHAPGIVDVTSGNNTVSFCQGASSTG